MEPCLLPPGLKKRIFVVINNTRASIAATFVIDVRTGFFEKGPKTYPIINTILAANKTRNKMIIPNITLIFD